MSEELELRFSNYAKAVRDYCAKATPSIINIEYIRQLVRSSASIAANYIEAADDLGKTDEKMKIKISRHETKETLYWLDMILTYKNIEMENEKGDLINEGTQIIKILSAILLKLIR